MTDLSEFTETERQQLLYISLLRGLNAAVDKRIAWQYRVQRCWREVDDEWVVFQYGCGTQSDHYHRYRVTAWLCGRWQKLKG